MVRSWSRPPTTADEDSVACIHCISPVFRSISRAMAKSAAAKMRDRGLLSESPDQHQRLAVCRRCPLYVQVDGKAYCGKPYARMMVRDMAADGCGCPLDAKTRSPREHCPRDSRGRAPVRHGNTCNCQWCMAKYAAVTA